MLTVGSLFSGIGGFDLGLERAGMRTVWFCEQDEFCQYVLAQHWPGVPCHPDVSRLTAADVEPIDVLCGGFPCQDLSYAGAGAGIDGARSGLWAEYARLIGELGPRYVIVENVSALLARGLGRVLGDLAALGYDAEWDCIPASTFGAPHRRDRVWLVAYPASEQHEGEGAAERRSTASGFPQADPHPNGGRRQERGEPYGGPQQPTPQRRHADGLREAMADTGERRDRRRDVPDAQERERPHGAVDRRRERRGPAGWWDAEPDVGRVAHGVPARMDRLRALGNALVPQIAEWIGGRVIAHEAAIESSA